MYEITNYGIPFCQSSQGKQTNLSIGLRITAIVLGIIAVIAGVLILLNVPGLGHLGNTAGWVTFSIGAFIALVGGIKKSEGRNGKPLVVPTPVETQEVPEELIEQFNALHKGSTVWIGAEKQAIVIGNCVGSGGAKRAMKISEDEVLMLPNTGNSFYEWRRMVDEEVQISERLTELGILTVQSKGIDLHLSEESDQIFPAYRCPSFNGLAKKGMYVIDGKNPISSCWRARSYFEGNEDRYSVESWLPIVKPLLQDIYTLAKYNCLFGSDSLNIVIIENEKGYTARYFGFDFSSKASVCDKIYGLREDDVTDEVVKFLPYALGKVFWEQYDCDTGRKNVVLANEYQRLSEEFQKQWPKILREMRN